MREFLLYTVAFPIVLGFAVAAWRRAWLLYTSYRHECLALSLARRDGAFARAYSTVKGLGGTIPAVNPWQREENGAQR